MSTVPAGGTRPVSIAVHGGMVYVANQGNTTAADVGANISGFAINGNDLVAIPNSTQALSGTTDVHPTDIAFSPDGNYVVVVERFAGKLDTFKLASGVAAAGNFQASAGQQPFAVDWSPEGFLLVAEVGNGTATGSSVSSYSLSPEGALTAITSKLPTLQGAACWIVSAGGFAYIANAATANITGVAVSETGALALHEPSGITATTGGGAIDIAVTPDRGYLYSLSSANHEVHPFAIGSDGSLGAMPVLVGLSTTSAGLVAR
jgi:DNA-binding beta-propeller fold protein YncE